MLGITPSGALDRIPEAEPVLQDSLCKFFALFIFGEDLTMLIDGSITPKMVKILERLEVNEPDVLSKLYSALFVFI